MMLLNNRNIVINKKRIVFLEHLQIEHTLSLHIIPFKSKCNLHRKLLWDLRREDGGAIGGELQGGGKPLSTRGRAVLPLKTRRAFSWPLVEVEL